MVQTNAFLPLYHMNEVKEEERVDRMSFTASSF